MGKVGPMSNVRLELVWPNKEKFLLSPQDENGKPVWVERSHPAAREVRLTEFSGAVGHVDDQNPERDNLLFVGDSLDALRVLNESPAFRREYRGKVKQIYVDPPFNTGQTFKHYDDWMEHSTWLSFMRDRLLLMKDLLATEGSIWVHLDEAEVHRMRCLMDEVFGSQNYISTMVWQKTYATKNDSKVPSSDCDFILVYAKAISSWTMNRLPRSEKSNQMYKNPDNDPRGLWRPDNFKGAGDQTDRPNLYFPITRPADGAEIWPVNSRWRYSRETVAQLEAEGRIWWGSDGLNDIPSYKRYLSEVNDLVPSTLLLNSEVGHSQEGKRENMTMFPEVRPFDTPKPERLIERVVSIGSNPGDVVLDCFGGSGTTAAVAHKMGRRWITVELSPSTSSTFTGPRLASVVNGTDQNGVSKSAGWAGGGGFRTVEIQDTFYALTALGVMLTDDAQGQRFARAVASQLGFDWDTTIEQLCGRRGRMRLAVIDGAVGVEELRSLVGKLDESERVTVVAQILLPGAEEWLSENSRGSLLLKAPAEVLKERRRRRRKTGVDE
jgi:adenine-specific DNA-methyltransferase